MNIGYIIIALASYLIGSIPFALIIVRFTMGKDVRTEGSGNIGAMNSYDATKKKWIGITVLVLDVMKGIACILLAKFLNPEFTGLALAAFFSVLGHNFSIYIKFKGGRGLATAAGAFALINPLIIIFWGLLFLAGWFIIKKNVHVANVTATVCAPLMLYYTPQILIDKFSTAGSVPVMHLIIAGAGVSVLILLKHIKPMVGLFKTSDEFKRIRK